MARAGGTPEVRLAVASAALTGESPVWHPRDNALYYVDVPGHKLHRFDPRSGALRHWEFDADVACLAPRLDGTLLLAMRDGLWSFDPASGERVLIEKPPYDPAKQRFNDGKCDPQGRFWVGTIDDAREPRAALFCYAHDAFAERVGGIANLNGLAWSPNGRTMHWSDTKTHTIFAADFDPPSGTLSRQRVFVQFPLKLADQPLSTYGGRPDGAAMDVEGFYWIAMYEGQRLLRISPAGEIDRVVELPVRCPTMPCFGGPDLKTLYITSASQGRPAAELIDQPWAGCVLALDVDVPGLPVNFAI